MPRSMNARVLQESALRHFLEVVRSGSVTEAALMPDINHMTAGPYEWVVFDEPAATLGVKLKREFEKPGERIDIKPTQRKRK